MGVPVGVLLLVGENEGLGVPLDDPPLESVAEGDWVADDLQGRARGARCAGKGRPLVCNIRRTSNTR